MATSSFSDLAAKAGVNANMFHDDRADELGNRLSDHIFIQSDRSRANELAEDCQQPSNTAMHGRPLAPG